MEAVKAVKSVSISYQPIEEILQLLKDFRSMVNYCLEIGLREGVTGRFKLMRLVYGDTSKIWLPLVVYFIGNRGCCIHS